MEVEFSNHALTRMDARNITKEEILSVMEYPDSIVDQEETARIYSKLVVQGTKRYLYRVFVNF